MTHWNLFKGLEGHGVKGIDISRLLLSRVENPSTTLHITFLNYLPSTTREEIVNNGSSHLVTPPQVLQTSY